MMSTEKPTFYHERQKLQLCALHSLNNLFQKHHFNKQTLDSIVHEYDQSWCWNEYSKLVIAELERLNDGITNLNVEIQDLKREIAELKVKEDFAKELWKWKQAVDEVASPSQLKSTVKDVAELKTFKTQAITIWAVVQLITTAIFAYFKFIK